MIWVIEIIILLLIKRIYNPQIDLQDETYIFIWYGKGDKRKNFKINKLI